MIQFLEAMNAFGRWGAGHLWRISLELTVLAAVVLAIVLIFRIRSPKVRHLFCCLVLAKPAAMLLVASPISLYWFLSPPAAMPAPPPAAAAPALDRAPVGVSRPPMRMPTRPLARPAREVAPAPAPAPAAWDTLDRYGVAALVWLGVASLLGLRLVVGFAYVGFLRQTARRQRTGPLADAIAEASGALGMRPRAAVALSQVAHGPVLAGVVRPVILLPGDLARQLSPEQMKRIVAHELAHVRRWDNAVLLVQRVMEMLLFFHPVVWACGWLMRREAEAACDDAVVACGGGDAEYADVLTSVAETRAGLTRRLLLNTFAAAESNLSRRIRRILRGRGGKTTLALSVASIIALIFVGCLGLPTAAQRKATFSSFI